MFHLSTKVLGFLLVGMLVLGAGFSIESSEDTHSKISDKDSSAVTIVGKRMAFSVDKFSAKSGEEITITFENDGKLPHNIGVLKKGSSVEDFSKEDLVVLSETIQPEESIDVRFTIDEPGEYTYVCNIPGHARAGMTGTLVVQ